MTIRRAPASASARTGRPPAGVDVVGSVARQPAERARTAGHVDLDGHRLAFHQLADPADEVQGPVQRLTQRSRVIGRRRAGWLPQAGCGGGAVGQRCAARVPRCSGRVSRPRRSRARQPGSQQQPRGPQARFQQLAAVESVGHVAHLSCLGLGSYRSYRSYRSPALAPDLLRHFRAALQVVAVAESLGVAVPLDDCIARVDGLDRTVGARHLNASPSASFHFFPVSRSSSQTCAGKPSPVMMAVMKVYWLGSTVAGGGGRAIGRRGSVPRWHRCSRPVWRNGAAWTTPW